MIRFLLSSIFFVLVSVNAANGQASGVLSGRVTDSSTGEPLAGVYAIYGKNMGEMTDSLGHFIIKAPAGHISVKFTFLGYESITRDFRLIAGDTLETEVSLKTEIKEIEQVVVTANRTGQRIAELSVSMDVIRNTFLSRNHITDATELVNKTPGIEVMDGQASIRGGSGYSYGAGSRVLALIDGLPVSSADAGNIKWQFLPLENISQIEIIKGASSVLYGSSALNGIINFRTADATNIPDTKFYAETGIFDRPRNRDWVWWNTPRTFSAISFSHLQKAGKNDVGIGLNLMNDEGYRRLNGEQLARLNLKMKHYSGKNENLVYGININSGLDDKTDFVQWEDATTGALKQSPTTAVEVNQKFLAADPYISLNRSANIRHDLKMRVQMSQNKFPVSTQNNSTAWSLYTEYQGWFRLAEKVDLTAGASELYSMIKSPFYGDHTSINVAGYTQFELRPVARLKAVAGVRLEYYALDNTERKTVPVFRAGINWEADKKTYLRASIGQGYRFPAIAEKFASTTLGSVTIIPNPGIRPESGWSSEAGIKRSVESGKITGQADLSVFYLKNKDLIEFHYGLYLEGLGFKAENVLQSEVYGYELEFSLNRPFGKLLAGVNGGYTFMYPVGSVKENDSFYLKYRRKHSGKLSITATREKIDMGLSLYVKSKILNVDNVFLHPATREPILPGFYDYWLSNNKAYITADFSAGYRLSNKYSISFTVKNVTNTEYMGRPGDIQPQRSFSLRFSGKF